VKFRINWRKFFRIIWRYAGTLGVPRQDSTGLRAHIHYVIES